MELKRETQTERDGRGLGEGEEKRRDRQGGVCVVKKKTERRRVIFVRRMLSRWRYKHQTQQIRTRVDWLSAARRNPETNRER